MLADRIVAELWPDRNASVEPLGGGLTNHNFKVTVGDEVFVLRVGGSDTELLGIDRGHEHEAAVVAAGLGVGPEVVAFLEHESCLVTRFVDADPFDSERIRQPETIARVARALRRIHDGPAVPGRFDAFRVVDAYADTVVVRGGTLPAEHAAAKATADRVEATLGSPSLRPCHNDLLNANLLEDGERIRIVDWEYAGMGDPFFDLANFAVNNGLTEDDDRLLLDSYGEPGDDAEARLVLMRFMSDFREAMWGAVQQAVSALDFDFLSYTGEHFERLEGTAASSRFRAALGGAVRG
jgi:thiamine kinase-like enzyme